jgi:DNA polymerase-3 subunit gamma/tau
MGSSLYLKWRPSQLEDIVGQKPVVATLKRASENNRFAHAYLFSGERGCGKTTIARILATLMTCEDIKDGKVCEKCHACKTISRGASLDVKEINGASNRGIENANKLIDAAQWSPQELKRKIYIIDECHQLTREAVSALLKPIEEPQAYLTFILCTTDVKKILPTILSRCQRFHFTKIPSKDIVKRLQVIAKAESINIDDDALLMVAKLARGSMRDAIGYLEQVGTVGISRKITKENIISYFGVTDRVGILDMVRAVKAGNIPMVMDQVNDMSMASANAKEIMCEVSEVFRNIMLLKARANVAKIVDLPDNEIEDLNKIGESMDMGQLIKLAHLFSDIERKMDFNINERWIMEATLINCVAILGSNNGKK